MGDYTYGNYVYFNNMTDTPNENHNHFILNQVPSFHITSPLKLMDDIFESLTKLSVNKMLKKWMKSHVQIVAQLSKFNVQNKDNQKMELIYNTTEK